LCSSSLALLIHPLGLTLLLFVCWRGTVAPPRSLFAPSQPPERCPALPPPDSLSTQPCGTSAPTPSITSSSSTLRMTPLAASPRSLPATPSTAARGQCSGGISAGMAALHRCSAKLGAARSVCSAERRSADTCAPPSSPPTARIVPSTTRSCCRRCGRRQALRCPSDRCNATARRSWADETNQARREQQTRVSPAAQAARVQHCCMRS